QTVTLQYAFWGSNGIPGAVRRRRPPVRRWLVDLMARRQKPRSPGASRAGFGEDGSRSPGPFVSYVRVDFVWLVSVLGGCVLDSELAAERDYHARVRLAMALMRDTVVELLGRYESDFKES